MTINFEDDTGLAVTDAQLKTIAALAAHQVDLEAQVTRAEEELKKLEADLRKVSEIDLPQAMGEAGMEAFTLADGSSVTVGETLYASFPKKDPKRSDAIKWLMEHDLETLVKESVIVPFDKGDHEKVVQLTGVLEANGVNTYQVDETVNTASVKAAIKELLENGTDVPTDLLGAYSVRRAEVKK